MCIRDRTKVFPARVVSTTNDLFDSIHSLICRINASSAFLRTEPLEPLPPQQTSEPKTRWHDAGGLQQLTPRLSTQNCLFSNKGSWHLLLLNGRRIGELSILQSEIDAWSNDVNNNQRGVDWQMKIDDARCKLKFVYPKIQCWQTTSLSNNRRVIYQLRIVSAVLFLLSVLAGGSDLTSERKA